jgi:hypothetical protein
VLKAIEEVARGGREGPQGTTSLPQQKAGVAGGDMATLVLGLAVVGGGAYVYWQAQQKEE